MRHLVEATAHWLLSPGQRVHDEEGIQRARLLSAILLVLVVLITTIVTLVIYADPRDITEPTVEGAIGLGGICILMYILDRAGYTSVAAIGLIVPFIALFVYIPFYSGESPIFLAFMLLPILLVALFFSLRWTVIVSVGLLGLLYILIAQQDPSFDNLTYWNMRNLWYFLLVAVGLIITYITHSNALENIRQQKLNQLHAQIIANEARLRALVENTPDFILEIDRLGNILFINRLAELYLGKNIRTILPEDQYARANEALQKAFRGEPQFIEIELVNPDGHKMWNSVRVGPVKQDGIVTSLTVTLTDITAQKEAQSKIYLINAELERLVKARTQELENANKELEAFSYSVSHDLRTPLRAIRGYSDILKKDFGDSLEHTGRNFLARVIAATTEMSEKIDALLLFSRLARSAIKRTQVDLSQLALSTLEILKAGDPERSITWEVTPGLIANADETLLRGVLENLLGNAWKYSLKNPRAHIVFGMEKQDNEDVYFVQDNGAGFDMKYADKLFGAFQRLHREDEFSGHGLGLASVKRIVARHGGRIWAYAEKGKGSTFYFTLGSSFSTGTTG